jgi:hypothetical protein
VFCIFYFFLLRFVSFRHIKIFTFRFIFSKVSFLCLKMRFHFPLFTHSNTNFYPIVLLLKKFTNFKYSLELDFSVRPVEPLIFLYWFFKLNEYILLFDLFVLIRTYHFLILIDGVNLPNSPFFILFHVRCFPQLNVKKVREKNRSLISLNYQLWLR